MLSFLRTCFIGLALFLYPVTVLAQTSLDVAQATVWVGCDGRQGSGTVIHPDEGYVLTSGHVALDHHTGIYAKECTVGFIENLSGAPTEFIKADIVEAIYFERDNQDFAVLRIRTPQGQGLGQQGIQKPYPFLKTFEFSELGDEISVLGFSGENETQVIREGEILNFFSGFIETDAEVASGDSGGTLANIDGHLIGIPTRIVTVTSSDGQTEVRFEHVDIRAVITWLDTISDEGHDEFIIHADAARYHEGVSFIEDDDLGCFDLVRSINSPSVFCLLPTGERLSFPSDVTFLSWFPNFEDIEFVADTFIQNYQLTRNVTFRPGTLVKVQTAPEVYVVVDAFGTMREVPSEEKAIELWGENWASLVHDVPDVFFTNYTVGPPLE